MRGKKATVNILFEIIVVIAAVVINLIIPKLIIDTYGSSMNGLRASISQFISYLFLIEMGLGGSIIYALYKPLTEKNTLKINAVLAAGKKSYNEIGLYFSGLIIVMMIIYPLFTSSESIPYAEVLLLVFAIGSAGVIDYFTAAKYKVLLMASQLNYIISIARILFLIIQTLIIFFLVNAGISLALVYLISLTSNIIQAAVIIYLTRIIFDFIDFSVGPDLDALNKRNDVVFHQISGMVVSGSPIILLTLFSTLENVSIYSIYLLLFLGINALTGVFTTGLPASFGQIIAERNEKALKEAYSQYEYFYYMLIAFAYSCVLILGISFLEIYTAGFDDANYVDYSLLILFTVMGILDNAKMPQSIIIIAAGHYKETRNRALNELILTLLFSTILVFVLGLKGVLIGSIIGLVYRSIDLFYAERIVGIPFKKTFYRLVRFIITILSAILPFLTFITLEKIDSLILWIVTAVGVAIWVGFVVVCINYFTEKAVMKAIVFRMLNIIRK